MPKNNNKTASPTATTTATTTASSLATTAAKTTTTAVATTTSTAIKQNKTVQNVKCKVLYTLKRFEFKFSLGMIRLG